MGRWLRGFLPAILLVLSGAGSIQAGEHEALPGLSTKDRIVLATMMVQQGQCRNGLAEVTEAMKDFPNDETLLRLKGSCEAELRLPEAYQTILRWLQVAPPDHPDRAKMLALLPRVQPSRAPTNDWILVPAGEFEMGAEGGVAQPDEAPKHRVYLDAFFVGKYEVTNAQYQAFVKATGHRPPENPQDPQLNLWKDTELLNGIGELPVVNVSWADAQAFCRWIGGRLPTEAEWEKAARGTDGRIYPWGNDPPTGNRANYSFEPIAPPWEGPATLARKDQYEFGRSPYGAFEMAGNVWEWTQDYYDEVYYKQGPTKNPTGPASGTDRVIRGGSWRNTADVIRSTNRNKHDPEGRQIFVGIRCAKDHIDSQAGKEAK